MMDEKTKKEEEEEEDGNGMRLGGTCQRRCQEVEGENGVISL